MKLSEEFNKKYAAYLEEDQLGMTFEIPSILNYVDEVFTDLVQIPGFKYSQIYTKFGLAKVYTNLEILLPFAGRILSQELEEKINFILKVEYEIERRLKIIEDAQVI
jgi:hypothetical protein